MLALEDTLRKLKLFELLENATSTVVAEIILFSVVGLLLISIIVILIIVLKNTKKRRAKRAAKALGLELQENNNNQEDEKLQKDNKEEEIKEKENSQNDDSSSPLLRKVNANVANKKPGKYEVFPIGENYFAYRLKASNGEILVTSELYKTTKGAKAAIENIIKNISDGQLVITKDKHNLYQFKLFGGNKRLLLVSANYSSQKSCENAANSFKNFATISPIVELQEDPQHLFEEINLGTRTPKEKGKFILLGDNKSYEFKLLASNGVTICSSNEFSSKDSAIKGIDTLKDAVNTGKFFVVKDKNDQYQFKLYSSSGRVICYGEVYSTKNGAIEAAKSVNNFIDCAVIVEN